MKAEAGAGGPHYVRFSAPLRHVFFRVETSPPERSAARSSMAAALLATSILGTSNPEYLDKIAEYRQKKADKILAEELPVGAGAIGFKK